jgi:hypothetical protein
VFAQGVPKDPGNPWRSDNQVRKELEQVNSNTSSTGIDFQKTYSLPELIDLGERRNPNTQVAWERHCQIGALYGCES